MKIKIAAYALGGAVLGIGIVLGINMYFEHGNQSEEGTSAPPTTSSQNASTMQGFAGTWSNALANAALPPKPSAPTPASNAAQRALNMEAARDSRTKALADPANLRVLIQQYFNERDPESRKKLKALLSTIDKPEVIDLAKQLIASGDPERRQDGVELIERQTVNSPEARSLIEQTLSSESSPAVLLRALAALKPVTVDSTEEQQVITQLLNLSQNPDAGVRRQSILSLGLWSHHGEAIERLTQASTDPVPEVRQAATFALAKINARSSRGQ
jgi:HEAT repeat protein